jgi:hypothetical protein
MTAQFNPLSQFNPVVQAGFSAQGGVSPATYRDLANQADRIQQLTRELVENMARCGLDDDCGESGGSRGSRGKSWLQAIAAALGRIADKAAAELQQAADAIGNGGNDPSKLMDFQVKAQEFSLMMQTFTGALKALGEGVTAPAQASAR